MAWQLLGALGLLLIVGGVAGGGVKLVGVGELPALKSPVAIVVCVLAGCVFLGMGYTTWREHPPTSSEERNPAVLIVDRVMDTIDRIVAAGGSSVGTGGGGGSGGGGGPVLPRNNQTIALSPTTGGAGTRIAVTGRGFDAGELVEVRFQAVLEATVPADGSGSFSTSISVPGGMASFHGAPLAVTASGRSSARSAEATFTIQ
jgi:hypothetical protein